MRFMSNGVTRTDTPYAWPSNLVLPSNDANLVYLDLNHWIYLAKAASGHRDGKRHVPALETLRQASTNDQLLFLLSSAHYMEMQGIKSPRQRSDIAEVMEELTGFMSLVSRSVLLRLELEASLDQLTEPLRVPYAPVELVGPGIFHALGKVGGLRVKDRFGHDVTADTRARWPGGPEAFDRWQRDGELLLERSILRGPTDDEAPDLRARGWRPEVARQTASERAEQEQKQAEVLSREEGGRWRRGRTRDVVAARFLFIELNEMLGSSLAARGVRLEEAFPTAAHSRKLTDAMPSADIAITLMTARHRSAEARWTANDIFDIDSMSIAVPYCDLVVTEQHMFHVLKTANVEERAKTTILHDLDSLASLFA
jgi:hypothetical protein